MASNLEEDLRAEMAAWEAAGLRRRLAESEAAPGLVDFATNDYLGLAGDPRVVEAARAALAEHGAGGRAARLLGGGSPLHAAAERAAAEWLGAEAALLFPCGYQANLGLVTSLVRRGDAVVSDRLNHASLIDAARLSRARIFVHAHRDLDELARILARTRGARRRLVITEGVFGMDGDLAPLGEMAEFCARHDAWLVVDEAHSAALLGPRGAGAWAAAAAAGASAERLVARVLTGGKALGITGAFVAASAVLVDHLVNHARPFVFTTAPSPAVAGALLAAMQLAAAGDERRARALGHARTLAARLALPAPGAAVVPVPQAGAEEALAAAGALRAAGLDVRAIRPPTVPSAGARLRIVCHSFNTDAEVDELARRLSAAPGRAAVAVAAARDRTLVVAGTDTGVGKTVVSALLLRAARRLGPAAYWKPVQTGAESDSEAVYDLAGAEGHEVLPPAWQFPLPASPHEAAAAAGQTIEPARLEEALAGLRRMLPDATLVVELAGGLLVPYRSGYTQADWLERAAAPLVLVARSGLGTLNHTLLTLEALRARHLEPRALFLVGDRHDSNRETLRRMGDVERVFEVPRFPALRPAALDDWLDENDLAEVLEA
ncbi:MAG: dethiobiotin synthase [Planctomycetota bacterium]